MHTIETAITAFEANPSDETARDINFATQDEGGTAYLLLPERGDVPAELMSSLKKAHQVLRSIDTPTELMGEYTKQIQLRCDLLQARINGDHQKVRAMLKAALEEIS